MRNGVESEGNEVQPLRYSEPSGAGAHRGQRGRSGTFVETIVRGWQDRQPRNRRSPGSHEAAAPMRSRTSLEGSWVWKGSNGWKVSAPAKTFGHADFTAMSSTEWESTMLEEAEQTGGYRSLTIARYLSH